MNRTGTAAMNVLLYQFGDHLADQLGEALVQHSPVVNADRCDDISQCLTHLENSKADLIFCGHAQGLTSLLTAISDHRVPVVMVSQQPEVREWLDAMDAGAADYCAAPFESHHVSWILHSNVGRPTHQIAIA
jgi:DNA-binding NtrC family response regulator